MKIIGLRYIHYSIKKKMNKKTYTKDFFIIKKKHHWFILPSLIFYYNKEEFFETGVYTPSWGMSIRWLIFMIGFQIQETYEK
jgi:hypothetical protein